MDTRLIAPNWTELPPLELRGLGTHLVESLHSYLCRLEQTTGFSLTSLGRYIGERTAGTVGFSSLSKRSLGFGVVSLAIVKQLEELTGNANLRCGTLWALSEVLSPQYRMFGVYPRRWCPRCYEEWDRNSYEPLIWTIDALGRCPRHDCDIEHLCPKCGAKQRRNSHPDRRRFCSACGASLWEAPRARKRPPLLDWMDQQVLQMVEYCSSPRKEPLARSDYMDFVAGVRANAVRSGKMVRIMNVALRGANRRVGHHFYAPTIRTLLNLCAVQGVEMSDFLNAPREASSPLLIDLWSGFHYLPIPSATQAEKIYVASRYLEDFLRANPIYLPPMKVLLRDMVVQKIALRDASFDLYDLYEKRFLSQGSWARQDVLRRAYFCALHIIGANEGMRVKSLARKVAALAECSIQDARLVSGAAVIVGRFKMETLLLRYKREQSPQDSFYWVMNRWAANATRAL